MARSDMLPDSDIDLFIVRPDAVEADDTRWTSRLRGIAATRWTGNDVRVLEMSATDVRRGIRARRPVFDDIRGEGIRLIGPAQYLRAVAARRKAGSG